MSNDQSVAGHHLQNPPELADVERELYVVNPTSQALACFQPMENDFDLKPLGSTHNLVTALDVAHAHVDSWFGKYLREGAVVFRYRDDEDGQPKFKPVFRRRSGCPACASLDAASPWFESLPEHVDEEVWTAIHAAQPLPAPGFMEGPSYRPWWVRDEDVREWPFDEVMFRLDREPAPYRDLDMIVDSTNQAAGDPAAKRPRGRPALS